jgi:hypothetical protein
MDLAMEEEAKANAPFLKIVMEDLRKSKPMLLPIRPNLAEYWMYINT